MTNKEHMFKVDLNKLMAEKAKSVQAIVQKVNTVREAVEYALSLPKTQAGHTITGMGLEEKDLLVLKHRCRTSGLDFLEPPFRPQTHPIHTSLTLVDWGIADTGTLVLNSTSEDMRIATMLGETHIALLPASKIKHDIEALVPEITKLIAADSSTYTAFITGASRTADIERTLAIGVHGPQELHILILEDAPQ